MSEEEEFVFESSHVGALMNIGAYRIQLETDAKELGGVATFGEGLHDFVDDRHLDDPQGLASVVLDHDPQAWSSVLRASLLMAQGADSHDELRARVLHLAAVATAWLEDIDNRTPIGLEPDRA